MYYLKHVTARHTKEMCCIHLRLICFCNSVECILLVFLSALFIYIVRVRLYYIDKTKCMMVCDVRIVGMKCLCMVVCSRLNTPTKLLAADQGFFFLVFVLIVAVTM